ncbi:MAG: hypothetical protein AB9861_16830 [Methanosarcina sp.]
MACQYFNKSNNKCLTFPNHDTTEEERSKYCNVEKTMNIKTSKYEAALMDDGYLLCPTYREYKKKYK